MMNKSLDMTQAQALADMIFRIIFKAFPHIENDSNEVYRLPKQDRLHRRCSAGSILALSLITAIAPLPAIAQITPDTTLGSESSQVTRNVMIRGANGDRIDGGAIRGSNLFHSFSDFNVNEGQRVYFANPSGITNILSRVTGNTRSDIMGTLGVDGSANLFLLNPNGIIFGPNARLDVSGSFTASTADSIAFPDGTRFSASAPDDPALLSVAVPLGVQYGTTTPGTITTAGNLMVGQNLSLLGSSVTSTGQLAAPSGQLLLEGVAGDVQVRQAVAQTATLSASHNLILQESQLQTAGDLNLLAGNTVQIRDSAANPFIAYAGGNLTVQGNQNIDIFALNHPLSGLVSGRDMVLRSVNTVGGDAHYWAGGNFRIEQLNGKLGNLFSPYDPVIRASGSVEFDSYTGASLHIFASGSVIINGDVTIENLDRMNGSPRESLEVPDPTGTAPIEERQITIDGQNEATLDIRSGVAVDLPSLPPFIILGAEDVDGSYQDNTQGTDIRIGSITNNIIGGRVYLQSVGSVVLTNVEGIPVGSLGNYSVSAFGNPVTISAQENVQIPQGIITASASGTDRGSIRIYSGNDIIVGTLLAAVNRGDAYNVTLRAGGNITAGDVSTDVRLPRNNPTTNNNNDPVYGLPDDIPNEIPEAPEEVIVEPGNGGSIRFVASGNIIVNSIKTSLGEGRQGTAGNVVLLSGGDITGVGNANAAEEISSDAYGIGNAGSIEIRANNNINLNRFIIHSNTRSEQGDVSPGNIVVYAGGTIHLENQSQISTQVGRGGRGEVNRGDITVTTSNLDLTGRSQINSFLNDDYGDNASPAPQGRAGDITINLLNNGSIAINGSNASPDYPSGIFSSVGNGTIHRIGLGDASGTGGNITLNLGSGSLTITGDPRNATAGIAAKTFAIGDAGSINITGNGSITIQNGGFLDNSTDSRGFVNSTGTPRSGNAGAISVTADSITLMNDDLARRAIQSSVQAPDPNGDSSVVRGSGGPITITANSLTINNAAISSEINETDNSTDRPYRGGDILINAPIIGIGSSLPNRLNGRGQPADGIIAATTGGSQAGSVTVGTERLTINGNARVYAGTSSSGAGGFVALRPSPNARSLTVNLNGNSQISASTSGAGLGGNLSITAPDSVRLTGRGRLTVGTTGAGSAGNLSIKTGQLTIQGGTRVSAEALGTSRAGNITVEAHDVTLRNNSQITASAESGRGGRVILGERLTSNRRAVAVNMNSLQVLNSEISAQVTRQNGQAGNLTIGANTVKLRGISNQLPHIPNLNASEQTRGGLFVRATGDEGRAGRLAITTNDLTLRDGAEATVSSRGVAGNLTINADAIELDDGRLTAIAGRSNQANIRITMAGTLFQLYNRSLISAGATGRGSGGNVRIDAANGFVLANPYGNSDIRADAFQGSGGDITITTNAIFGLEERDPLTPLSDINAASQFSTNGTIILNTLNVDPTRGLGELPIDLVDTAGLVADGCVGRNRTGVTDQGEFTRTGRGGLSLSPNAPLTSEATTDQLATLDSTATPSRSASIPDAPQTQPLVEAQGLGLNAEGKVSLVVGSSSTRTAPAVEQSSACRVSQF